MSGHAHAVTLRNYPNCQSPVPFSLLRALRPRYTTWISSLVSCIALLSVVPQCCVTLKIELEQEWLSRKLDLSTVYWDFLNMLL